MIMLAMEYILIFVIDAQLGMWLYVNNHVKHPPFWDSVDNKTSFTRSFLWFWLFWCR